MNGKTAMFNAISTDAGVLALVSSIGTYPCIASGALEPTTWGPDLSTVLVYRLNPVDYTIDALLADYTVNCRAKTEIKAEALAQAVVAAINRKEITAGGRFYCQWGFVVQPSDTTDNFNCPVEVRLKGELDLN